MTRVSRKAVLPLACAVAFAGLLLGGSAYAQIYDPQPYLVYEVPPEPVTPVPVVDLADQFISEQDVPVVERYLFMNPVEKVPLSPPGQPEPITDALLHYRWHRIQIDDPGTFRDVAVTNQFGTDVRWTIKTAPEYLLAPTSKTFPPDDPGPEPTANHYDCYEATTAPPAGAIVDLFDQFGPHGPADVMEARYLCAPAIKTKDQTVYPIFEASDGRDHLACYDVPPHPHTEVVNTRNQFTDPAVPDLTQIIEDRMLCVPSEKQRLDFDPQPYLVYEVPPMPVVPPPLVDLEDQFNRWQDAAVLERWFHMNPVDKLPMSPPGEIEPITDPELHYRWYILDLDCQYTYDVFVTNQFAFDEPWTIRGDPEFLLAPASKIIGPGEPGPPPPGQHYDCYEVLFAPPMMPTIVDLVDQFGPHLMRNVLDPRYLCAPAEKTTEGGMVYPIIPAADGRDHLACYELILEDWIEQVSTRDQFTGPAPDEDIVVGERMLCVPTAKAHRLVPSLAPWGVAALGLLMLVTVFGVVQRRARRGKPA
jgi:hypothetical protein